MQYAFHCPFYGTYGNWSIVLDPSLCLQAAASGLIINSMGWVQDLGYDLLLHTLHALKVDVVLVLGDDRLYANLQKHCRCPP